MIKSAHLKNKELPFNDRVATVERFSNQMRWIENSDWLIAVLYCLVLVAFVALQMHDMVYIAPTIVILIGMSARVGVVTKVRYDTEILLEEVKKFENRYSLHPNLSEANTNRLKYLELYFAKKDRSILFRWITELWMLDSVFRRWNKIRHVFSGT